MKYTVKLKKCYKIAQYAHSGPRRPMILSLGSGPDRGQSPVEWGDFASVHMSRQASEPARQASEPASQASEAWLALKPA